MAAEGVRGEGEGEIERCVRTLSINIQVEDSKATLIACLGTLVVNKQLRIKECQADFKCCDDRKQ